MIAIQLLGGLGLFIAGMNMMSRGIEKVAGNKLRGILKAFTKTRLLGLLVGLFFTAVIQSSSAATVMVVSFVNSGLMTLSEACGIILGANIGTTVTALLVAVRLSTVAPIFVFAGAVMVNFIKTPVVRKSGEIVLGFGVLFVGISTMSTAMAALREMPEVIDLLGIFANPFLGVLLGLVITSVVQSSSVTVSILVVMAAQGLVDLHLCMFVILGCNIGACTSAVLASLSGNKNSKRAALIHLLFNIYGTILMFVLLLLFPVQIENIIRFFSGHGTDAGSLGRSIAWAHVLFKVFQVAVFYPFMNMIVKCTYALVRGEDETPAEEPFTLRYIGASRLPNPAVAILVAVQEMERMAHMAFDNLNLAVECLVTNDAEGCRHVFETEKYIDFLDEKISDYLVKINQNTLPIADANRIAAYFHVVSDIERIGDHAESIVELVPELYEDGIQWSEDSVNELRTMMTAVNRILDESLTMFLTGDKTHMQEISDLENMIDQMERSLQSQHILRLSEGKCSAQAGIYFSDVVSGLERVGDHAINIAFSLVEAEQR
ncbi:MAG: Na/Pi cotransporter family protein [Agathobaculum sp.]|uniref:Na/Pi cotransporter family protein n=1 Tax=Agathobaculum sp. TaxID=2048138 RepID=UPI003D9350C6